MTMQKSISSLIGQASKKSTKGPSISLKEFLNRKLKHRTLEQNTFNSAVGEDGPDSAFYCALTKRDTQRACPLPLDDQGVSLPFAASREPHEIHDDRPGKLHPQPNKRARSQRNVVERRAEPAVPETFSYAVPMQDTGLPLDYRQTNDVERSSSLLLEDQPTACCPVCNIWMPAEAMQRHVTQELDEMESGSAHLARKNISYKKRFSSTLGNLHYQTSEGTKTETRLANTLTKSSKGVLVLGDQPKKRDRKNSRSDKHDWFKTKDAFNHYADGGGWWGEDAVGVVSEEVGSIGTWEGVGCMTFGSTF